MIHLHPKHHERGTQRVIGLDPDAVAYLLGELQGATTARLVIEIEPDLRLFETGLKSYLKVSSDGRTWGYPGIEVTVRDEALYGAAAVTR